MRQLTLDEAAHLDSIMGMTIGEVSAQAPAESHASTEVTFQGNAGTDSTRPVELPPGHRWQGELAPEQVEEWPGGIFKWGGYVTEPNTESRETSWSILNSQWQEDRKIRINILQGISAKRRKKEGRLPLL